jgi:DNA adenine methylase
MRYPGGKGGAGVHQTIINLMPPHRVYIEAFVGGGNIFERKRPAPATILIDADDRCADYWQKLASGAPIGINGDGRAFVTGSITVIHGDAGQFLKSYNFLGDELVYCDPPYVMASRSGRRRIYQHEMTDEQHCDLIAVLLTLPAAVMLSGYRNTIYDELLAHWRRVDFQAMTRGGVRTESVWMNYDPPAVPAELTYLGTDYRERERIKRKKARWAEKLRKLPIAEQAAIMEVLLELASPKTALRDPTANSGDRILPVEIAVQASIVKNDDPVRIVESVGAAV